jgi:transcriptional regulator with XRE-family HTH domain
VDESPVRCVRLKLHWSQAQLASFCGLKSTATISFLERGVLPELPPRVEAALRRLGIDGAVVATQQRSFAQAARQQAEAAARAALRAEAPGSCQSADPLPYAPCSKASPSGLCVPLQNTDGLPKEKPHHD